MLRADCFSSKMFGFGLDDILLLSQEYRTKGKYGINSDVKSNIRIWINTILHFHSIDISIFPF